MGAVLSVVYTIWWQKEAALLVLAIASVTVGIAGATYAVADRMAVGIRAELTATAVLVTSIVIVRIRWLKPQLLRAFSPGF